MADAMADATASEMAGSSAAFPDPAVVRYSAIGWPVVGEGQSVAASRQHDPITQRFSRKKTALRARSSAVRAGDS